MTTYPKLIIAHLYPKEMNIYGDTGNRKVLEKRLAWRGIPYEVCEVSVGDKLPNNVDIILGGGGQDASQGAIEQDLITRSNELQELVNKGVVMLMVCGMYQLLGRKFITSDGTEIAGLGILPIETIAKQGRLIGNLVTERDDCGMLVGYENHSGRTYLDAGASSLAYVVKGSGNDDGSGHEGCEYKNVFGTYMHGPILAKNPGFADLLISRALSRRGFGKELPGLDDELEHTAQKVASSRPR